MDKLSEIKELMQQGQAKNFVTLVQEALDEGIEANVILNDALLAGMAIIGDKFKREEIFVPEVLVAARAMNKGVEVLKPYLQDSSNISKGTAVLGTVKGDLHDIGKNLVRIMMEGKGIDVIDLGTNGEIVVGNKDGMMATSSAAGPAFEGVGITCGGPSIPGAISEVTIKDNKVTYHTIDNKAAKCICGSGLISLFASLKRNDIIDELGRFKNSKKQFNIAYNIYITQKDIQTFQLAKAAIQAGVKALLDENGNVDQIYISGGFGSHLQVKDLVELKILPPEVNVECVNNSALSGAYTLLRHQDLKRLDHIVDVCKNINLAEYPDFDDYLIDGLYF